MVYKQKFASMYIVCISHTVEWPWFVLYIMYNLTLSWIGSFWTDISKCSEGVGAKFFDFFFHRDIRNKKVCKVKNFQIWVASRYFEQKVKKRGGRGVLRPPPTCIKGVTGQLKESVIIKFNLPQLFSKFGREKRKRSTKETVFVFGINFVVHVLRVGMIPIDFLPKESS